MDYAVSHTAVVTLLRYITATLLKRNTILATTEITFFVQSIYNVFFW